MHSSRIIRGKESVSDVDVKIKSYLDKAEKIRAEHPDLYEAMAKDNKKINQVTLFVRYCSISVIIVGSSSSLKTV
ncbi:MAG: hypothetical protein KGI27_14960, partial [Thaumarchaeota archaeon]|nr:hypothetical protein [Nitrososphaerota archaeon]